MTGKPTGLFLPVAWGCNKASYKGNSCRRACSQKSSLCIAIISPHDLARHIPQDHNRLLSIRFINSRITVDHPHFLKATAIPTWGKFEIIRTKALARSCKKNETGWKLYTS
jgi:hypothetical protein